MAHVGEKSRLGPAGLLSCRQGVFEGLILGHGPAGLRVDIRKTGAHLADPVAVPLLRSADPREPDHLIALPALPADHIAEGDDPLVLQPLPDIVRLDELQKVVEIGLRDILPGIGRHGFQITEVVPRLEPVIDAGMSLVADALILFQIQIIDAPVVRSQCGDQAGLALPAPDRVEQLLLQGQALFLLLLQGPLLRLLRLGIQGLGDIDTEPQRAEPSVYIRKLLLGRLKMPGETGRVRYVLKKDIGPIHSQGLPVVLHKMGSRHRVENIKIRESHDSIRRLLVGILGKGLAAGQIPAGLRIL